MGGVSNFGEFEKVYLDLLSSEGARMLSKMSYLGLIIPNIPLNYGTVYAYDRNKDSLFRSVSINRSRDTYPTLEMEV